MHKITLGGIDVIQIKNIAVKYPDGHEALKDINLSIKAGESVAIVGANGAGKSTLLMTMVGIVSIHQGVIKINDLEVKKDHLIDIRKQVGVVFQNPDDQLFMPRVCDDIAFGPRNYGIPEEEVKRRVDWALETMGIEHLKERYSHKMSGGEKRSAAIASVLSMEPSIVLFDEPSSFLDPRARRKLITALKELSFTKIIATHDLDMALDICNRVIVLKEGTVFADGASEKILFDEELMLGCGLELPLSYHK